MITYLKVLSIYMSDDVSRGVCQCVEQIDGAQHQMKDKNRGATLQDLAGDELPDVVIYQMNGHDEIDFDELSDFIAMNHRTTAVIVVRKEVDVETTRRLMRLGVRDVIPFPMDQQELVMLLGECLSEKRRRITDEHGNLAGTTTFINAKGGCGATSIAMNVACAIAKHYDVKVALLDFNVQFGDIALYMDLKPTATMIDALIQAERLDPVFLDTLMTKHDSDVDVLVAPSHLESLAEIKTNDVNKLLETVVQSYDYVFIDLPHVVTPWIIDTLRFSEHVMMVVQNSLSTIKNAKLLMRSFPEMGVNADKLELINNRAMAKTNSVDFAKLKAALGREKMHRVRNDFEVALSAQDQGVPFETISHKSPVTQDIKHLADYIWSRQNGNFKGKGHGFLSRIFKRDGERAQSHLH
jgi:pilus assembly protein CpaE